ncbi:MAG TPA: hypothetical protein DFI00_05540 [Rhodospirillaceae bacterium]|nr:hypothetical protein [Alphaproteobacteria bacterium]OUT41458.1 MAG: hypothetical protein CBB62_03700 [Micavibrio sp. TMED2]HCI46737.1 hypothetical protein [Rhodospirillaceae bacterium]MAS46994.1 hypothetical protein [Alphaproteobacteria bacterium]MAX95088.1 hypothetical protein [Alphaproteobacteria bacterium]|tara:strand:+ start:3598 stop:4005 length:408 start_codon:yes stop_codon:yes gene_type:complete
MLRLFTWPIMAVVSLVLVSFALSNRNPVEIALFPLPGTLTLPLFLLVLVVAFVAMLVGGFVIWCNAAPRRKAGRAAEKQAAALEKELAGVKAELAKRPPSPVPQTLLSPPNPLVVPEQPKTIDAADADKVDRVAS